MQLLRIAVRVHIPLNRARLAVVIARLVERVQVHVHLGRVVELAVFGRCPAQLVLRLRMSDDRLGSADSRELILVPLIIFSPA